MLPISDPVSDPVSAPAPAPESVPAPSSAVVPEMNAMSDPATTANETEAAALAAEPVSPAAALMSPAACAAQLKQLFPALFTGVAKPLKLRIQADIQARAPGLFTKPLLSVVLRRYTGSHSYLVALTQAAHRFDLDGVPAGELSAEHKQVAMDELTLRRANLKAAQRAPQKSAQRNPRSAGQGAAAAVQPEVTSENALETNPQNASNSAPNSAPHNAPKAHTRPAARSDADKAAQLHIQKTAQRETRAAQRVEAEQNALEDQKRRNRATLLHDFENTTLTAANFSALKGITVEAMQGYLATAREEAQARRSAPMGASNTAREAVQDARNPHPHPRQPGPRQSRDRRPQQTVGANPDGRNNRPAREPQG